MTRYPFEYVVVRVVPRVERGESINAGVVVYCQELNYLGARTHLDADRLRALDPTADLDAIETALRALTDTCASAGTGPVHTGLTTDPDAEADRLLDLLVRAVAR